MVQLDNHELVERLGIPYRDLRQMDPFIPQPYPSTILLRENAIVLSLSKIRLITTKVRARDDGWYRVRTRSSSLFITLAGLAAACTGGAR